MSVSIHALCVRHDVRPQPFSFSAMSTSFAIAKSPARRIHMLAKERAKRRFEKCECKLLLSDICHFALPSAEAELVSAKKEGGFVGSDGRSLGAATRQSRVVSNSRDASDRSLP